MTPDRDVYSAPQSPAWSPAPAAAPIEGEGRPANLSQEINERRSRIENAELLRHLRGL